MLLLCEVITSVYTEHSLLHIHVLDMYEHTNQVWSHDHPKHTCFADSYIINHSFIYI